MAHSPLYTGTATVGAFVCFAAFAVVVLGVAQVLPRTRSRLQTAAVWVPVVSMLVLFFPLGFNAFITFVSVMCMTEYRNILFTVYKDRFSEAVANDKRPVHIAAFLISLAAPTGDLRILHGCTLSVFCCLLVYHYVRYPRFAPSLFLLDFYGLFWAVFCLTYGSMSCNLPHGRGFMLLSLWLSWLGDAAAFFVGRKLGKHKVVPLVSPGKTWEGVAAEYVVSVLFVFFMRSLSGVAWMDVPPISIGQFMVLAFVLGTCGVLGDLVESLVKRIGDKKDSGDFFRGHGGFLDRFDSFFLCSAMLHVLLRTSVLAVGAQES